MTNQQYAEEIAEKWNVPASGAGYVTRFEVASEFMNRYDIHKVGTHHHTELWVPAEELEDLNDHIVGRIEVVKKFPGDAPEITPS